MLTAIDAGLDVDKFAPRLSFFFSSHSNFLEEVAKFRAALRMWARIMRDHFHAKNPKSQMLRFHTQTAGSTLTAQQLEIKIARTTLQALPAVLGGTQSLHTVEDIARGTGNLIPVIVEGVEANGRVGEISDAMRRVYGEYHETVVIQQLASRGICAKHEQQ